MCDLHSPDFNVALNLLLIGVVLAVFLALALYQLASLAVDRIAHRLFGHESERDIDRRYYSQLYLDLVGQIAELDPSGGAARCLGSRRAASGATPLGNTGGTTSGGAK